MTLQLHESAINNLAFDALANRTMYEDKAQAGAKDLLGRLPESLKGDTEDDSLWAIVFDKEEPVRVSFADNGFKIVIKGIKCQKGNYYDNNGVKLFKVARECGRTKISAAYTIHHTPEGFKAVRQGPISVVPYGSAGAGVEQRSTRLSLKHRFEKMLKPEFVSKGIEFSGRWKAAGKLVPIQFECRDGWAVLAWKRAAGARPPLRRRSPRQSNGRHNPRSHAPRGNALARRSASPAPTQSVGKMAVPTQSVGRRKGDGRAAVLLLSSPSPSSSDGEEAPEP